MTFKLTFKYFRDNPKTELLSAFQIKFYLNVTKFTFT